MFRNVVLAFLVVSIVAGLVLFRRAAAQHLAVQAARARQEIELERSANAELRERVARLEQERNQLQKEATEVHRLRAEISSLRSANKSLEQQVVRSQASAEASATQPASAPAIFTPPAFTTYGEMGKFVGGLRAKAFGAGAVSPEERQYLQSLKPELEKLERSPAEFAAFQTELIQSAAGISDPDTTDKIRQLIQHVYENAVSRGLDIPSRPADDLAWVDERFQLDRRGTKAVEGMLNDQERAAFGKQFIGIMGVDLGVGVDKSAYPRGFLGEAPK